MDTPTTDTKSIIAKDDLRKLLIENECIVEFTKVNGEIRSMPCTLNEFLIPQPEHETNTDNPIDFPKPKKEKKENPDVMSVWCTDKNQWRSFRLENLISIKVKND